MKKFTLLSMLFTLAICFNSYAQSTINITTAGGTYATEKWVNITTAIDGGGTQVWGQGDGSYGDSPGYLNVDIPIAPGTYYVNCYDKYADGWDGTLISITAYGATLNDNGGSPPNDSTDDDASSAFGDTQAQELEASLMIIVPNPPSCFGPLSLNSTPSSLTETTLSWTAGGSETDWTYEYGSLFADCRFIACRNACGNSCLRIRRFSLGCFRMDSIGFCSCANYSRCFFSS